MLTPLPRKVFVRPLQDPDEIEFASGVKLLVPDSAKGRSDQGIVKYVGADCKTVRIGDHVVFSGYSGDVLEIEGEGKLISLHERAIAAIIHDEPLHIPGLYLKVSEGKFIPATHEGAIEILYRHYDKHRTVTPALTTFTQGHLNDVRGKHLREEYPDDE